jgi:hypothetical protein
VPACTREPFDRQNRLFDAGSRTGKALLAHNSDTLESAMGAAAFDRRLRSCLGDGRVRRAGPFRHDIILRELCGLDRSRLLLTPRT